MRIAYVLTSLGMGGAERQVLALAERMAGRGHTVKLLVLRPVLPQEWTTHLDIVRLEMRRTPASFFLGLLRGRRFLREFSPDLVHSHSFHANFVARLIKIVTPAPTVLSTVHNVNEGGWRRMMAYRVTDPLSCCTTAVSRAVRDEFVRLGAVPEAKCLVVSNGIDTAEFAPDPERRAEMRAASGAGVSFVWLATGRIVPAKDYPNLLRAFARVREACSEAQLWIAGEAPGLGRMQVNAPTLRQEPQDGVRWLGLCRDIPALLDAADAFVLSSAWEGMPLAVGEAMAMGKPVVATEVGGVRELMDDAGLLVPPRNAEALAGAMISLEQATDQDRQTLCGQARARIQQKFGMDAKADEWERLYRTLLARGQ
jgi:glycosyltransferase involved in cell wall biosynthesis